MSAFPLLRRGSAAALLLATPLLSGCVRSGYYGRSPWALFILVLDIVAWLDIFRQPTWDTSKKLLWAAVIFFLPVLGLIIYYLFSGRSKAPK